MKEKLFTRYEVFMITVLSFLQFTIVLDFIVLSPLSAVLMPALKIKPAQFGMVVSAYAFSAGISGLLAAGFADKFDRKKMLLFFYAGFIIGTLLCALAPDYKFLMAARIVTGLFGGVISAISFAIITDLFRMEVRGRVMGFVQSAFAASQVLGVPVGLFLADRWGWHATFLMIVVISTVVGIFMVIYIKPIDAHLQIKSERKPFQHLMKTISAVPYLKAFAATTLLATGGFMLMPFASAYGVNNLGIPFSKFQLVYFVTGIFSVACGPLIGKLSDVIGKYKVFVVGSIWSIIIVLIYCNLGVTPLWLFMLISVLMFVGVSSRMISSSALLTAIPLPQDRGAFMSINSAVQQISGGIATAIAGMIIVQRTETSALENYDILGFVVVGAMTLTIFMMYFIHRDITAKTQPQAA
ncbi:MAG TPA: MFS transporter [Ohtaekwangia sp.]|nr:MFS transporter [Ohtaekwangia sp.]